MTVTEIFDHTLAELRRQKAVAIPTEGGRIGVISCPVCGCALVLDERDVEAGLNTVVTHAVWHGYTETTSNE